MAKIWLNSKTINEYLACIFFLGTFEEKKWLSILEMWTRTRFVWEWSESEVSSVLSVWCKLLIILAFSLDLSGRCVKTQFSTAYPARLNGVISQGEFRESIDNINSKIPSTKAQIFCIVIVIICLIVGIWLLLASISISKGTAASVFMIFIGVGIGLTAFGAVFLPLGCHVLHIQRTKRLRQVVAEESKKYWSRSAERCNWRLEVTRVLTRCFVRRVYVYHVSSRISSTRCFSK
jgi:hypothetical protein